MIKVSSVKDFVDFVDIAKNLNYSQQIIGSIYETKKGFTVGALSLGKTEIAYKYSYLLACPLFTVALLGEVPASKADAVKAELSKLQVQYAKSFEIDKENNIIFLT